MYTDILEEHATCISMIEVGRVRMWLGYIAIFKEAGHLDPQELDETETGPGQKNCSHFLFPALNIPDQVVPSPLHRDLRDQIPLNLPILTTFSTNKLQP
jgi:hypothetical protein